MTHLLLFLACSGTAKDTSAFSEPESNEPSTTPDTDNRPADNCDESDTEFFRLEGTVAFEDGTAADKTNVRVQMCKSACFNSSWGDNGLFCFKDLSPGTYAFHVSPYGREGYPDPLSAITIPEDQDRITLDSPIIIPPFTHNQACEGEEENCVLTDGSFDAGNGLSIDIVGSSYIAPLGGEVAVQSVSVDPSSVGLPIEDIAIEDIVGMWYLGPYQAESNPKWSFSMTDTELETGSVVQIYSANYDAKRFQPMGTATVNDSGVLVSDSESGIGELTTLLLVK